MRRSPRSVLPVVALVAAGALAACGGPTATASPRPTAVPVATASEAPVAEASPDATEAPAGTAGPTGGGSPQASTGPASSLGLFDPGSTLPPGTLRWPGDVIDAALALAVLDNGIKQAGADLAKAAQDRDMQLFLGASTGLATIVEEALPSARTLAGYDATKQVGESYLPVLSQLDAAASGMAAGLRAGDAAQVEAASGQLSSALEVYRGVRAGMVDIADRAILMRRGALE